MRFSYKYTNYPLSKELTEKSRRLGLLTQPIYGIILGVLPGLAAACIFPHSASIPMVLMFAGIIAGPILLAMLRKKKNAQYDAEYQKILQAAKK